MSATKREPEMILVDIDQLERLVDQITEVAHDLARAYGVTAPPPPKRPRPTHLKALRGEHDG